jgi:tetratricopeptide (TPR) repeat protein
MLRNLMRSIAGRGPAAVAPVPVPAPPRDPAAVAAAAARPAPAAPAADEPYQSSQEAERRGDLAGAEQVLRAYIGAHPDDISAHASLGAFLIRFDRYAEARTALGSALRQFPRVPPLLLNMGLALQADMRIDEAIAAFRLVLAAEPNFPSARFLLGLKLLLKGEYPEGFVLLRARNELSGAPPPFWVQHVPPWQGESLAGKRLLTWLDWGGLGDEIQFARYVPLIKQRYPDAHVTLGCSQESLRLLAVLPGVDEIFSAAGAVQADYQAPLLELPCVFGTTVDTLPSPERYLAALASDRQAWAKRLDGMAGLRVGLCWSSGFWGSKDRSPKSVPLELLAPLQAIPGVRLFSLQKGPALADLQQTHLRIEDYDADLRDLADTAALIENLDLVVSVDTSVAHLAGALGKPVIMMLKFESGSFWLTDIDHSPWYRSMRIVRQDRPGDWAAVAEKTLQLVRDWRTGTR